MKKPKLDPWLIVLYLSVLASVFVFLFNWAIGDEEKETEPYAIARALEPIR